jgi:pimeloyl-ACP methyl ester carboxylesterase
MTDVPCPKPVQPEAAPRDQPVRGNDILLVMVPGMGMREADLHAQGLIAAVEQRRWPVTVATVDPGPDAYLDGSVEQRLFDGIAHAQRATGAARVWLAGISLGCQAILRCIRTRPGVAEGVMLVTPYLASTGLMADIGRSGGLRRCAAEHPARDEPDRALLAWLATTPRSNLPLMFVGHARNDRFASTAILLADLLPPGQLISVAGEHDWTSWGHLWRLMLDQCPFRQAAASTS